MKKRLPWNDDIRLLPVRPDYEILILRPGAIDDRKFGFNQSNGETFDLPVGAVFPEDP